MAVRVLIPAHDEQTGLPGVLHALRQQSQPADYVTVVSDNSTDNTIAIARENGAAVFESVDNDEKKAGALNQWFDANLEDIPDNDIILIQDGDTQLASGFIGAAVRELDAGAGACGGVFYGEAGGGLLGQLQRSEFARYARALSRNGGKARVLTGTGTAFRASVLKHLMAARRSGRLPGGTGVYTTASLTEDGEVTLAVKSLGYKCVSPRECSVVTEVMPTVKRLWKQRSRWQRGALDDLAVYGFTRVTTPYILRQVLMGLSVVAFFLCWTLSPYIYTHYGFKFSWFWSSISVLFITERVWTVRKAGWKAMLLSLAMLPELCYDFFQHAVWVHSVTGLVLKIKPDKW